MGWSSPAKSLNPKDPADKEQKPKQGSSPRRSDPGWKKEILPRLHEDFANRAQPHRAHHPAEKQLLFWQCTLQAGRSSLCSHPSCSSAPSPHTTRHSRGQNTGSLLGMGRWRLQSFHESNPVVPLRDTQIVLFPWVVTV